MFSKFKELRESESGTVVTVFILAVAILFVVIIGAGFALGKYVQAVQTLDRCASMTAKATMVYMQRQAPPNKGVLTVEAKAEGDRIFRNGLCNSNYQYAALMPNTQVITYQMMGAETLLVTVQQYVRAYSIINALPIPITQQAVAYTYQYGDTSQNPIYNAPITP